VRQELSSIVREIHIKKIHNHMRETELKEEEIKQYEEALKKREKKCSIREEQ
jgi:hypothetical protein